MKEPRTPLARKRAEQEAKVRRARRLKRVGIGVTAVVLIAAIVAIVYFVAIRNDGETTSGVTELTIKDVGVGTGTEATAGHTLSVHYTGWLMDGTKFDSSLDRGQPFEFVLGQGRVIKGWDQGLVGMKEGGTRELLIPASLAYGASGSGKIPPNAPLKFEVQLLDVK